MGKERTTTSTTNSAAVFLPRLHNGMHAGFRSAHTEKLLKSSTRVRIQTRVDVEPVKCATGEDAVRVTGALTLHGPYARLLFRKGTETGPTVGIAPVTAESALLPTAPRVPIPERIFLVTTPTRPYVWFEFRDRFNKPLANSICLGRIDEHMLRGEPMFEVSATLSVWLSAQKLSAKRGPVLDLTGELTFPEGVSLRIKMAESCDRLGGPDGQVGVADIHVLPPEVSMQIPQREVAPGAADNPWVSVMVKDWSGGLNGGEVPIGRCVRHPWGGVPARGAGAMRHPSLGTTGHA